MEIPPWNMSDIHTGRENTEQNGLSDGQLSRLGINNVPVYEDGDEEQDFGVLEHTQVDEIISDRIAVTNVTNVTINDIIANNLLLRSEIALLKDQLQILEDRIRRIEENG